MVSGVFGCMNRPYIQHYVARPEPERAPDYDYHSNHN